MKRLSTIARTIAASCGFVIAFGLVAPAAHATEFGSDPSATASEQCDAMADPFDFIGGQWHVHLENSNFGKVAAHFEVTVDQQKTQTADLDPDNSSDLLIRGFDGLPSHIVVTADGKTLVDTTTTAHCNDPYYDIVFQCAGPFPNLSVNTVSFGIGNDTDVPHLFELHRADGSVTSMVKYSMQGATNAFHDVIAEDAPYDVWIALDGVDVKHISGVADCVADTPPPTTTPQDPPPSDPPPVTAPPATEPPAQVLGLEVTQPALPRTGVDTLPLTTAGLGLIGVGSLALAAQRRRLRTK